MLEQHEKDYKPEAWKQYTFAELGQWVDLLVKRANHRSNPDKRKKDLEDARNYLTMMDENLKEMGV